jgi:acetyltransferase
LRYFTPLKFEQRTAHQRLSRLCFIDYDREIALVAERGHAKNGDREIMGVGRLLKLRGTNDAEFALTIADPWQRHGLGTDLLRALIQIGRDEKLDRLTATILGDNHAMQHLARKCGFSLAGDFQTHEYRAELKL